MTREGLEFLLDRVSTWPEEAQGELLKSIEDIESRYAVVYRMTDEEREAVQRGLADMRAGRFATDEAVATMFNRYLA
jgi:hypothetical protein